MRTSTAAIPEGRDPKVLDGLSFKVEPGKTVALVGSNGSGKTTVMKLLSAFYEPQGGRILLYGRDLREWELSSARKRMSVVSQDTYLFPVTIAENISYGRPGATRDEVAAAAGVANAHEFITALPDGYDTVVGEWGARLSGGERQRIAIARAVLKDAPILLLDEPTSALDAGSEALVQEALERLMADRTVLVIAHRLSTIVRADEILVLSQGFIAESGTHESLMAREGLYRQLYSRESREAREDGEARETGRAWGENLR